MITLGISPFHDSSVVLLEDHKILRFYKEERLSRKKRDKAPYLSLIAALKDIPHVDLIVYSAPIQNDQYLNSILEFISKLTTFTDVIDLSNKHHLQHASMSFYNSGFSNAAVIVVDRNGSDFMNSCREAETVFMASYPSNFTEIYKSYWMYSNTGHEAARILQEEMPDCEIDIRSQFNITKVYETATSLIGQHPLENGKTMGLSAYGNKSIEFESLFYPKTNIPQDFNLSHVNEFGDYEAAYGPFVKHTTENINENNYQFYADYAWQVQKQTQSAVCNLIEKAIALGAKNICISGGYGLNVVANSYYKEQYPNISFYFEPLADDSGNSVGGAYLGYRSSTLDNNIYPLKNTFYHGVQTKVLEEGNEYSPSMIANDILNHKIVAVFGGLAEAGPRSLGNRSILFYPDLKETKNIINKVKNREWYRPFAASVLEEDAEDLFYMHNSKNEYMTESFIVKEKTKTIFPGIVHIDNTCRIQTVDKNSPLYDILIEIKKITGYGLVLNTSFNLAGEPLVESWQDAKDTFYRSSIDILWNRDIRKALLK